MALTPEITAEILQKYRLSRSPFKVAKSVGVSVEEVILTIERHEEKLSASPERNGGAGRPELQAFVVTKRLALEGGWNNDLPEIIKARVDFEAGTHIMATGRDGAYLLLYSIPRTGRKKPAPDYFVPEVA